MKYSNYIERRIINIGHSFDGEDGKPPEEHVIEKAGYVAKKLGNILSDRSIIQGPLPNIGGIVFESSNDDDYDFSIEICNDGRMDIVDFSIVVDNIEEGYIIFCNVEEIIEYFKNRKNSDYE